jgi:CheY-like chemotaxis protein
VHDSLLNLILNARDALGPKGTITVSVRRVRDTWLEFRVEDDGPGFSPEALKRGMDPFFTTKGGEGSGLGLAMVFDHASLSGGSLRLANRDGGGARVTLRLPFRLGTERRAPVLVLLVEDSPDLRTHVREVLRSLGHTVIEAASAEEARGIATLEGIGFVLSDIQLAGSETGLSLLDGLGARLPGVPMGLMTSLPPGDPRHVSAAARHRVLRKPFSQHQLESFLDACRAGAVAVAPASGARV